MANASRSARFTTCENDRSSRIACSSIFSATSVSKLMDFRCIVWFIKRVYSWCRFIKRSRGLINFFLENCRAMV